MRVMRAGQLDQHSGPAHSKGGTDVILYASQYDGEPECIINVCGRFFLATGIEERFGADIFTRLKEEGPISMPHPNSDGPGLAPDGGGAVGWMVPT